MVPGFHMSCLMHLITGIFRSTKQYIVDFQCFALVLFVCLFLKHRLVFQVMSSLQDLVGLIMLSMPHDPLNGSSILPGALEHIKAGHGVVSSRDFELFLHIDKDFKSDVLTNIYIYVSFKTSDDYGQRQNYRKKISGKKGRVPTAACFSIINYSCKKWGIISKRHLQHFPLHSKNFL